MKIGILTLPLHTNYGGILQAYALQTVLERMGHEVILIDKGWPPHYSFIKKFNILSKDVIKKLLNRGNNLSWHWTFFRNREIEAEHEQTFKFVSTYIKRKVIPNLFSIREGEYEGFVVGSDQIWREHHYRPIENAFLDFTKDWPVKRVSYAASFGTDEWEYSEKQTLLCSSLLKKFDEVSVRESNAVNLCKKYFDCDAVHVLDPTLLLSPSDYVTSIKIANEPKSKGDFLVYILDMTDEKKQIVDHLTKKFGLTPFVVNSKCEDKNQPLTKRIQPPVEQWLRGFYDAKFVFTDSFHACAFAINFNKPFFVFGNKMRGMSRFYSLLHTFGLNRRLIQSKSDVERCIDHEIDWNSVNTILMQKRKESKLFLSNILKS